MLHTYIYPFEMRVRVKLIIEAIKYVVFFHLELFSICFRLNDDIIDGANGREPDICNLRKLWVCLFDMVQMMNLENEKVSH